MKALLVADTDSSVRKLSEYIRPYGFDVIRYRSAVKALDNIEEIRPDAVFISTGDFPRHWKTLVQFIRADTAKDESVIVLLVNDRFTSDDADKAVHIGVQAIVNESLSGPEDEQQLLKVFSRYRHLGTDASYSKQRSFEKAVFLFTNPVSDTIITGKVEDLSASEIVFKPDAPSMTSDLTIGENIGQCSLKLDETILSPKCRVLKNGYLLVLEIIDANQAQSEAIEAFNA